MNLTPLSYVWIAAICGLGIVDQWVEGSPGGWWRLGLAAWVACLGYEWLRCRSAGLSLDTSTIGQLRLGYREHLTVSLGNSSASAWRVNYAPGLPVNVQFGPLSLPATVSIAPGETVDLCFTACASQLGKHHWHRLNMRLKGLLGLAWWTSDLPVNRDLDVVPDMLGRSTKSPGMSRQGQTRSNAAGTGQSLSHLREYRPGDPRRSVDWKGTARTGKLITRVFAEHQHLQIILILDTGRTSRTEMQGLSMLGHYINLSARLAEHIIANEDQIGLLAMSDCIRAQVLPGRTLATLLKIRHCLTDLVSEAVETNPLLAALEVTRMTRNRSLVVFLSDLYSEGSHGRLNDAVRLLAPKHLPVVVSLISEELDEMCHRSATHWQDPYISLAAQEYRVTLQGQSDRLKRSGAISLLLRPEHLEQQVLKTYGLLKQRRRV